MASASFASKQSTLCVIEERKHMSRALYHCCSQDLCITIQKQLIEHNAAESLVDIRPLVIKSKLIEIDWRLPKMIPFDISRLSPPYLSEYFNEKYCYCGMTATGNEQHLLLYEDHTLYIFDHLLRIEK